MTDAQIRELLNRVYEDGWCAAAHWAKREDLEADIGSSAYIADRDSALAAFEVAPAPQPPDWLKEAERLVKAYADAHASKLMNNAGRMRDPFDSGVTAAMTAWMALLAHLARKVEVAPAPQPEDETP